MPDITRFRLPRFEWEPDPEHADRWATRETPESAGWSLHVNRAGREFYATVKGGFLEESVAYEIKWADFRDTMEDAKRAAEEYVSSLCRACMVVDERANEADDEEGNE